MTQDKVISGKIFVSMFVFQTCLCLSLTYAALLRGHPWVGFVLVVLVADFALSRWSPHRRPLLRL